MPRLKWIDGRVFEVEEKDVPQFNAELEAAKSEQKAPVESAQSIPQEDKYNMAESFAMGTGSGAFDIPKIARSAIEALPTADTNYQQKLAEESQNKEAALLDKLESKIAIEANRPSPNADKLAKLQEMLANVRSLPTTESGAQEKIEGPGTFLDRYYKAKEEYERQKDLAWNQNPWSYGAGTVAGGLTTGAGGSLAAGKLALQGGKLAKAGKLLPGGVLPENLALTRANLVKAAVEGAKVGALSGALKGKAETLRGDLSGTAEEVGKEALIGGGLGAVGQGALSAGAGALGLLSQLRPAQAFSKARQMTLGGTEYTPAAINAERSKLGGQLFEVLNQVGKKLGVEKQTLMEFADEMGARINAGDDIETAIGSLIRRVEQNDTSSKTKALVDELRYLQKNPAIFKTPKTPEKVALAERQLEKKGLEPYTESAVEEVIPGVKREISDIYGQAPEGEMLYKKSIVGNENLATPQPKAPEFDITKMTTQEAQDLYKTLTGLERAYPERATELTQLKMAIRKKMNAEQARIIDELKISQPQLADVVEKQHRFLTAMDKIQKRSRPGSEASQTRKEEFGDKVRMLLEGESPKQVNILHNIEKADPEAAKQLYKLKEQSSVLQEMAGEAPPHSKSATLWALMLAGKLGAQAGKVQRQLIGGPSSSSIASTKMGEIVKIMSKEEAETLARGSIGTPFETAVKRALESKGAAQTAAVYALLSNPAFREFYAKLLSGSNSTFSGSGEEPR